MTMDEMERKRIRLWLYSLVISAMAFPASGVGASTAAQEPADWWAAGALVVIGSIACGVVFLSYSRLERMLGLKQ